MLGDGRLPLSLSRGLPAAQTRGQPPGCSNGLPRRRHGSYSPAGFLDPALLDRAILASGGDCFVSLPSGETMTVPHDFCFTKSTLTPAETHLFSASFVAPPGWEGKPRLRKGHDISGHIFLLTMSILFLADQLRPSLRHPFTPLAYNTQIRCSGKHSSNCDMALRQCYNERLFPLSSREDYGIQWVFRSWMLFYTDILPSPRRNDIWSHSNTISNHGKHGARGKATFKLECSIMMLEG